MLTTTALPAEVLTLAATSSKGVTTPAPALNLHTPRLAIVRTPKTQNPYLADMMPSQDETIRLRPCDGACRWMSRASSTSAPSAPAPGPFKTRRWRSTRSGRRFAWLVMAGGRVLAALLGEGWVGWCRGLVCWCRGNSLQGGKQAWAGAAAHGFELAWDVFFFLFFFSLQVF